MTKSDLETILLKIRNRCGLEEQTKITYYWDEEKRIVFKIFFDSLYLPEVQAQKLYCTFPVLIQSLFPLNEGE